MIGIVSGILVSYIVFPSHARQHINQIAVPLTQALRRLLDDYTTQLLAVSSKQETEDRIQMIVPQLDQLNMLVEQSAYEWGGSETAKRFRRYAVALQQAFYSFIGAHRQCEMNTETQVCLALFENEIKALRHSISYLFDQELAFIQGHAPPVALQEAIALCKQDWRAFKQSCQQQRPILKSQVSTAAVDRLIRYMMAFRQAACAFERLLVTKTEEKPMGRHCSITRLWRHDMFYVQHAATGAAAILIVQFIWLVLAFPGFQQIAISIAAAFGMSHMGVRQKSFLRFTGCLIVALLAVLCLGLDVENLEVFLGVIFLASCVLLYVHYDQENVSYVGTQVAVVFLLDILMRCTQPPP